MTQGFSSCIRRGMTLVELLVSLTILAVMSTTIAYMLHAGAQVSGSLTNSMNTQWEVESAISRMEQEMRVCTSLNVPSGVTAGNSFTLVTQPDANNANATYNVSYGVATVNGTSCLQETDPRYGTSTLIHGVSAFSVQLKNVGLPQVVMITITAGSSPAVTRTFRVMPRNQ